jgi:WD40 repeat protein
MSPYGRGQLTSVVRAFLFGYFHVLFGEDLILARILVLACLLVNSHCAIVSNTQAAEPRQNEGLDKDFHFTPGKGRVYAFTPDGQWKAKFVESKFYIIDRVNGPSEGKLFFVASTITCWSFSPDSQFLAVAGGYKKGSDNWGFIEVWEIKSRNKVAFKHAVEGSRAIGYVTAVGFGQDSHEVMFEAERHKIDGK